MTAGAWTLLGVAGVLAAGDWLAVVRDDRRLEFVCKPGALAALIGVALTLDPAHGDVRAWFVLALALSLAGDVFLMLPSDRFVAGLASFLLAHVAYVVGLTRHGGSAGALFFAAVPVVIVTATLGARFLAAARARGHDELVGPLVAYMTVIAAMVTCALASGNALAALGAVLFMTSDALIAETRFVGARRCAPLVIMVTYHLGQAGLTLSLVHG